MLVKHIFKQGLLLKNAGVISRAAYHGNDTKVTMNDLPVPQGDWYEHHSRQNAKYNAILLTGFVCLVGSITVLKTTDIIDFNFSPPDTYE